jgi:hypothetical protein
MSESPPKISAEVETAAKNFWAAAASELDSLVRFDLLAKGWDRMAANWKPESSASARFRDLCASFPEVAWSDSVTRLLTEFGRPILNDQADGPIAADEFEKAERSYERHRRGRQSPDADAELMRSVGRLLWTIRSNSMHGYKTPAGPIGPNERDRKICDLASDVLRDLYRLSLHLS